MSTITKESIADTIEGLEHLANSGIQSVFIDMAIAGMRRLLASLEAEIHSYTFEDDPRPLYTAQPAPIEAEPVAYMWDSDRKDVDAPGYYRPEHKIFAESSVKRYGGKVVALYAAPPAPVVDADDNFYSWFGREWHEHYQQNQYTTAAKQMLGVMAESAWKAGRRAAMLQGSDVSLTNEGNITDNAEMITDKIADDGNSPFVSDGWVLVPVEPTYQMCKAMGLPWEIPRFPDRYKAMIAAAPRQEVK